MSTVSHRPRPIATLWIFKLHHYRGLGHLDSGFTASAPGQPYETAPAVENAPG